MKLSKHCLTSMAWSMKNSAHHRGDAMKRFICTAAVLLVLCVPARADDGLSMDEATDIILSHHGVVTDMDVTDYLTLDAEAMTCEVREHNNYSHRGL